MLLFYNLRFVKGALPFMFKRRDIDENEHFILVNRKVNTFFCLSFVSQITETSSFDKYNWYPEASLKCPNQSSTQSLMIHLNIIFISFTFVV